MIRYGPLAFIGIPGEPTAAVGRRIAELAKKSGIRFPLVISFANEWLGYILTREEYEAGGYEATLSFHGPGLADAVAEAAEEAIRRTSASKD
ncbi:MAG: neutral/alkaline non-lysosomal ceramidase N-terminal domain-containing protein [Armatimonadetes bacterium]|nr:neutral/alkaline non-lysosomal ceramidase N-terminal domain-containing protein [Armatimonadota bacterium]